MFTNTIYQQHLVLISLQLSAVSFCHNLVSFCVHLLYICQLFSYYSVLLNTYKLRSTLSHFVTYVIIFNVHLFLLLLNAFPVLFLWLFSCLEFCHIPICLFFYFTLSSLLRCLFIFERDRKGVDWIGV